MASMTFCWPDRHWCQVEDVIRTRVYIHNVDDWKPVSRVRGNLFGHIQPANTLGQSGLTGDNYLVEMEAKAIFGDARDGGQ